MESDADKPLTQGWIEKRSRHLKRWRRRWMVLTSKYLCTFKSENLKGRTERILLQQCATIKSVDEDLKIPLSFRLDCRDTSFYFRALDVSSKEMWIGAIGKYMIKPGVLRSVSEEEALNGER
jgi:hypothetical protein